MKTKVKLLVSVVLAVLGIVFFVAPQASASNLGSGSGATPKGHCVIVLKRLTPGSPHATAVSKKCASGPANFAPQSPDGTLLATFFEDAGYGGYSIGLIGGSGPCDSLGYNWDDITYANEEVDGITSYQVFNDCGTTDIYWGLNETDFCGTHTGSVPNVGAYCNDHVYSIFLRN